MSTYNLLDEPWLPVRWSENIPPSEIGLRNVLLQAHKIEEFATDNPLETIALNRLLAALVAAVFPELAEESDWYEHWQHGQFDVERSEEYFKQYEERFDLLAPDRPFFGHPHPESKEVSPLSRLLHAAASGNNAVLFSHDLDGVPKVLTLSEAARALVCTQAAALGGGIAQPFNLSHGPLVGGAYFWLRGATDERPSLFKALLLNLAPIAAVWGNGQDDHPTWEAKDPPVACKRVVGGIRDLFTFQSRRLQLVIDCGRQVTGVRYNQGSKIEQLLFHDPHLAYRVGKEGVFPLRFNAGRALWQDSAIFMLTLDKKGEGGHAPRTFEWLCSYGGFLGLDRHVAFSADVFGLVNDQAKVELWRHERMTIYPDILSHPDRWAALETLIKEVQHWYEYRLREATRAFATRTRLNKPWGIRLSDVERGDRDAFVQALDTSSHYWPALGQAFPTFLHQLATVSIESLAAVQEKWQGMVRKTARYALHRVLDQYQLSHSAWQASSEAEIVLLTGTLYHTSNKTQSE